IWQYPGNLICLAYAPDGKSIAVGGSKGVVVFGRTDGHGSRALASIGLVWSVAFSRDGKYLLTGGDDGRALLWHGDSLEKAGVFVNPSSVHAVAFAPDGSRALAGCGDGAVRFWDVATGTPLSQYDKVKQKDLIQALAVSPDGTKLAV